MRGVGAFSVAGRLEQHEACDLAALDRLQLLVHEFMVAGRNEPEHLPGSIVPDSFAANTTRPAM